MPSIHAKELCGCWLACLVVPSVHLQEVPSAHRESVRDASTAKSGPDFLSTSTRYLFGRKGGTGKAKKCMVLANLVEVRIVLDLSSGR
jgi:hypothetical protein